jgi:hypothetical protein
MQPLASQRTAISIFATDLTSADQGKTTSEASSRVSVRSTAGLNPLARRVRLPAEAGNGEDNDEAEGG